MKISQLLDELNISLNTLKRFEKKLNCEFLFEDQVISDKIVDDLKELLKESKHQTDYKKLKRPRILGDINNFKSFKTEYPKTSATKEKRLQVLKGLYKNTTHYKLIAKVKWYYNHANDGEYGFLTCSELPDIHFSGNAVKGINPMQLRANDEVIIQVPIQTLEHKLKISTSAVNKIEYEEDLRFLLFQCLTKNNQDCFDHSLNQAKLQIEKIASENFFSVIEAYLKSSKLELPKAVFVYNFCKAGEVNLLDEIILKVKEDLTNSEQFEFWLQTSANFPFEVIASSIVTHIIRTKNYALLDRLSDKKKSTILLEIIDEVIDANSNNKDIVEIITQCNVHNVKVDYNLFNNEQLYNLWLNGALSYTPIDIIFSKIDSLSNIRNQREENELNTIFNKVTEQELKDLFSKIHFDKNEIKTDREFNLAKLYIDKVPDRELAVYLFDLIYSKSSDYLKIKWFILDYTDALKYHEAVIFTGLLNPEMQKLFFKKVIMLIDIKQLQLTLDDLNKITTIDYKTNEHAKEIDGVGLDFTLNVILKLLTDLSNNTVTKRQTIFEIIANQIKQPNDLLVIDGFFESCDGRTIIKQENNDLPASKDVEEIIYSLEKTEYLPRFSTFCDGRKAVIKNTGKPSLCRKSRLEFWWCENQKCYNPCRKIHKSDNWKSYTLEDVLRILKISYSEQQYEIVLNVVNRVNRFLEHLSCGSCSTILKPNGKSNYGFYGVSMFSCTNNQCEKPDKDVYLSHCLNGHCEDIIDSRTTVKCKPSELGYSEHSDSCGWYICQNCYSCCSSNKLESRKSIYEYRGQEYKCHTKGHKDLGILCCPKCGTETNAITSNKELYKKQLQWFMNHRNTSSIIASGQRNDGKWWFRWSKENLEHTRFIEALKNLKNNGFQVPDIDSETDIQFIAEPFDKISEEPSKFSCPNCEHTIEIAYNLDAEFDYTRINTIKKFHSNIFTNFKEKTNNA